MPTAKSEPKTKALPGSLEASLEDVHARLYDAIMASGLAGGQFYIHGVIPPDHVIVCVMRGGGDMGEMDDMGDRAMPVLDITYIEDADGAITVLSAAPAAVAVTTTEELVPVTDGVTEAMAAMGEGAYLSDDSAEEKSDEGQLAFKSFDIDAKALAPAEVNGIKGFTVEGYFSEWNTTDNEGDITRPGFTDYSVQKWGLPPVRYEHGMNAGVTLSVKSDDYGPMCKLFIPEDTQTSLLYKLLKVGGVAKMSYGYKILPGGAKRLPTGERELTAIRLMEISPVAIPMHDGTQITAVKTGLQDGPVKTHLADVTRALYSATAHAKAFATARMAKNEDLGDANWEAIATFAAASGDALADLTGIEVKAGRTTAKARWKLIAQLRDTLSALIDSIPEDERADGSATDSTGKGQSPEPVTDPIPDGKGDDSAPIEADAWRLELDFLTRKLAHHGQRINTNGN